MGTSDLLRLYMDSLAAKGYSPELIGDLEAHCLNAEVDMRKQRDRDQEDIEIAKLIPHGVDAVMERFGTKRRNTFYRAGRGRELLKGVQAA